MVGGQGNHEGAGGGTWGTRTISNFNRTETIGEGTYGRVFSGFDKVNNTKVAIKKLLLQQDCQLPPTVTREIKILKQMKHFNIVRLIDVVTSKCSRYEFKDKDEMEGGGLNTAQRSGGSRAAGKEKGGGGGLNLRMGHIYLVMEYVDHDLAGLIDAKVELTGQRIKCFVKQILDGLNYMHEREIVHRDLKCSNILVSNLHDVKLADFGLARSVDFSQYDRDEMPNLTTKVVTLWYRAPELLYGNPNYGTEVDMWSLGCIIVELIQGKPLFPASNEIELLGMIYNLLGTPSAEVFERMKAPNSTMLLPPEKKKSQFADKYRHILGTAYDLVQRLLVLDPRQRLTAKMALNNLYFLDDPVADPHLLPKLALDHQSYHEFETKKVKREKKQLLQEQQEAAQLAKEGKAAPSFPAASSNNRYSFPPGVPRPPSLPPHLAVPPYPPGPPGFLPPPLHPNVHHPYGGYPNGGPPPHLLHQHTGQAGGHARTGSIDDHDMDISDEDENHSFSQNSKPQPPPPPPPPQAKEEKGGGRGVEKEDRHNGKRRGEERDRDHERERDGGAAGGGRKRRRSGDERENEERPKDRVKPKAKLSEAEIRRRQAILGEMTGGSVVATTITTVSSSAAVAAAGAAGKEDRETSNSRDRGKAESPVSRPRDRDREEAPGLHSKRPGDGGGRRDERQREGQVPKDRGGRGGDRAEVVKERRGRSGERQQEALKEGKGRSGERELPAREKRGRSGERKDHAKDVRERSGGREKAPKDRRARSGDREEVPRDRKGRSGEREEQSVKGRRRGEDGGGDGRKERGRSSDGHRALSVTPSKVGASRRARDRSGEHGEDRERNRGRGGHKERPRSREPDDRRHGRPYHEEERGNKSMRGDAAEGDGRRKSGWGDRGGHAARQEYPLDDRRDRSYPPQQRGVGGARRGEREEGYRDKRGKDRHHNHHRRDRNERGRSGGGGDRRDRSRERNDSGRGGDRRKTRERSHERKKDRSRGKRDEKGRSHRDRSGERRRKDDGGKSSKRSEKRDEEKSRKKLRSSSADSESSSSNSSGSSSDTSSTTSSSSSSLSSGDSGERRQSGEKSKAAGDK